MSKRCITIEVASNGDFTYRPALLHADPGDSVSWFCNDGPFTVSFPERTPFSVVTIAGKKGQETKKEPFRKNVEPGVYHYRVAVAVAPNAHAQLSAATVYMDSGCPGVEIP